MAPSRRRAACVVGILLVVAGVAVMDAMLPAPLGWRLVPMGYKVTSQLRRPQWLPGVVQPPLGCAGWTTSTGEGLPPRLLGHPHTRPGYFVRKVGGLLPREGKACKARSKGTTQKRSCSNSTANSSSRPQPHLYIAYIADGGMANQAISHWNALAAAIALGAKGIIMPPARVRTNWTVALKTEWVAAPVDGVWDIASLHKYAAGKGIEVVTSPCSFEHYELKERYLLQDNNFFGLDPSEVLALPGYALRLYTPRQFVAQVKQKIAKHMADATWGGGAANITTSSSSSSSSLSVKAQPAPPQRLLLSMRSGLFMLKTRKNALLSEVAMNLRFAPHLQAIAQRITDDILRHTGSRVFNGVHLRVEQDAAGWYERDYRGGLKNAWHLYLVATRAAGFNASTPLFVASGIMAHLTPGQRKQLARFNGTVASTIIDKTPFLTADEAATLHWTQLAVIDFLVLANAQGLVTFDPSTFSSYLVEYRLLHMGVPRETATCILGLCENWPDPEARVVANGILFDTFEEVAGPDSSANATT